MTICSGCLSQGRRVKSLESIAMTRTLVWLQLNAFPACSMLCWECEADLARANRFRQRVQLAQFMFGKHKVKEVKSKENIITMMMSKEFAIGQGDLSLSTFSTVQLGEENHIHIKQDDEGYIEPEVKMEQELWDPIVPKEEIRDPIGNYSEDDVSLDANSNPNYENLHLQPISSFIHQQSPTVTSDIKSELATTFTNSSTTATYSSITSTNCTKTSSNSTTDSFNSTTTSDNSSTTSSNFTKRSASSKIISTNSTTTSTNSTTTSGISTTTSANSTTQKSTNEVTANSQKNIDFVPEGNTAYKVIKVTEEEMLRYRKCARNENSFKTHSLKCESCIKVFKSDIEYDTHDRLHQHWAGPLLCEICSCCFINENIFKQHCEDHRNVYECLKCPYQHPVKDTIHEHLKENHSIFLCQFCFMELDCDIALTDHIVVQHMEWEKRAKKAPHKCEQCGKIFKSKSQLINHKETHLNREDRKKECPQCHKRVIKLDQHILTWHTSNQESYCETCMKQFLCVDTYKTHLKTSIVHNPASQPEGYCGKCNKQFSSVKNYEKHLANMHTNDPDSFECNHCQKLFQNQRNLQNHIDMVHEKKFECKYCLRLLQNQRRLQDHIDIVHEKKLPFACEYDGCKYKTSRKKSLKAHIQKTHDTHYIQPERKRDMICQYCGAGFSSSNVLNNHILIHTGEKLYHCAHCEWKFAFRGAFVTHLRGKHPEVVQPREKRSKDLESGSQLNKKFTVSSFPRT